MFYFRFTTIVPFLLAMVVGMSLLVSPVVAEPTTTINYQGKLTDSDGVAVADGSYNMRFWLLSSPSIATTSAEWTESLTGSNKVQVTNGLFSVMLGSTTPLTSVDFGQALYLGVEIGGSTTPAWDGEMSPRKPLGTVPAAFEAFKLGGVASSSFLRSDQEDIMSATTTSTLFTVTQNGTGDILNLFEGATEVMTVTATDVMFPGGSRVGIGTSTPSATLAIQGGGVSAGPAPMALYAKGGTSVSGGHGGGIHLETGAGGIGYGGALNLITGDSGEDHGGTINITSGSGIGAGSSGGTINLTAGGGLASDGNINLNPGNTFGNGKILLATTGGNVGVGTSSPYAKLSVDGDLALTGGIYDSSASLGTVGQILQTTGAGVQWVATSSLGISGGGPASLAEGYVFRGNSSNLAEATSTLFIDSAGKVGIGTVAPNARLNVSDSGISNGNYLFNFGSGVNVFTGWKENIQNDIIHYGFGSSTPSSFVSIVGPDQQDVTSGDNSVDVLTVIGGKADSGFGVWPAGNGGGIIMTAGEGGDDIGGGGGLGGNITLNPGAGAGASGNVILANLQGNVGIGTTSPNAKLTVAGDINIDDTNNDLGGIDLNGVSLATGSTTLNNFFFGGSAPATFTSGATYNYTIGLDSLSYLSSGDYNFAVGRNALSGSTTAGMSGSYNNALGQESLYSNATGEHNNAVGYQSLYRNTTGISNNALGRITLFNNTTGSYNNAFGNSALLYNTTGSYNNALGLEALLSNTTGANNNAIGQHALRANTTGAGNNVFGFQALDSNNGTGNIAIGYGAAENATSVDRGIFIGYNIDAFSTTQDDVLNIGNLIFGNNVDGTGTTYSTGNIGIGTSSPYAKLSVDGDLALTGGIYDSSASLGTAGMILQTTGAGTRWVATSSLGISGGSSDDTIITVAANDTPATEKAAADYVADGTDDEVQIQAALDSLPVTGGTVQLLSGTFNVGTTTYPANAILIDTPNTRLIGEGKSTIIRAQDGDDGMTVITVSSADDVYVGYLKVDGNRANNPVDTSAINFSISDRGVVERVDLRNLASVGVVVADSENVSVKDSYIYNTNIAVGSYAAESLVLKGNTIEFNDNPLGSIAGMNNALISDNHFINNQSAFAAGVAMIDSDSNYNVISNNHMVATGTSPFISIPSGAIGNRLFGNTFINPDTTTYVADAGTDTIYNESYRQTLVTETSQDYNLFSIIGSTTATSAAITQLGTGDIFTLNNATNRVFTVLNNGNVGIGTASPNAKLTVAGDINVDDTVGYTGGVSLNGVSLAIGSTTLNNFFFAGSSPTSFSSALFSEAEYNYGIGEGSLENLSTGDDNFAVGMNALAGSSTAGMSGGRNNALGYSALYKNTSGSNNNAFGYNTLANNTTGSHNNALGLAALYANTSGSYNNAFGYNTLVDNTTGEGNNAFGRDSMNSNTDGDFNNAFGNFSLRENTTGSSNNALGYRTLQNNTTGSFNNALGTQALYSNATGTYNNAFTPSALYFNISGSHNNAMGQSTLYDNISGSNNNAFGQSALTNNTIGTNNNALGTQALFRNVGGLHNNAFGQSALSENISGSQNNAVGRYSLYSNTGSENNAIGHRALYANLSGSYNNAFGTNALDSNSGTGNIAIGYNAAENATGVDRGIFLGYNIDAFSTTEDDVLNIGNLIFGNNVNGINTTYSTGNIGIGTSSPFTKLTVAGGFLATGGIYDNNYTRGTVGQILQTTGTGVTWVATSTLGLSNPFGASIDPTELTATDFGSFTCNGATCSVDSSAITSAMLLDDTVGFADISYVNTLAANPALGVNETFFGTNGILFEGGTADNFEGLLQSVVSGSDKTWTLPNQSGVISLTGSAMTGTFDGNDFAGGAVATGDLLYGSGAGTIAELSAVATGNVLLSGGVSTAPAWGKVGLGTHVSGTLGATNGGTGLNTTTASQLLIGGAGNTWTQIATSSLGIKNNDTIITVAANDTPANEKTNADYVASGTDDEITIQAALDTLPSDGGTIQLLSGTFNVGTTSYATSSIYINKSGVTLIGQGYGTIIKLQDNTNGNHTVITVDPTVYYVTIQSMAVDGNKLNNTVGEKNGIGTLFGSEYTDIQRVSVNNIKNRAISLAGSYGQVKSSIVESSGSGILLAGPYNILSNNYINDIDTNGIVVYFGTSNLIEGNYITEVGGDAAFVVLSTGNSFASNFFVNNGGGVNTNLNISSAHDNQIIDNSFSATGTAAMVTVGAGSARNTLSGNKYVNPDTTDYISDAGTNTRYNETNRRTITTEDTKDYNLFSIVGDTTATSAAITQLGTGDILTLDNSSGRVLTVNNDGHVGIGTSSPNSILHVENTGFDGAGLMGIYQNLVTTNSVNGAIQYGTINQIIMNNTATTTLLGEVINVTDNSNFSNFVFGLSVATKDGSNTKGVNTAISATGETYGIQGFTTGSSSNLNEPAGGFFETQGTTVGNAIRGYSSSITTASLLSLFQDASDFEGTGLEMSFGNAGGNFSSTTSKYLDFQTGGTSYFSVSAYGTTTIGDGSQQAGLQIMNGGLCVDNGSGGGCSASTTGRIAAVDYYTGNSDLAEMYFSDSDLETGEIVTLSGGLSIDRADKDSTTPVLGVVSTKPGLTLGADDSSLEEGEKAYPVALSGRVPIKLSNENGVINKGDQLMLSSLSGVAMKATGTGAVVGIALEDFDEDRMYSDTFVNQFGDDMVEPVFTPVITNTDPRINDGCYYGSGLNADGSLCVPLVSTTTDGQIEEVNEIIEGESIAEELQKLREEDSETFALDNGENVKVGQIVMFVNLSYRWVDDSQLASIGVLIGTEADLDSLRPDFFESEDKPLIIAIIDTMKEMWSKITQNFDKNQEQERKIENLNERIRLLEEALDVESVDVEESDQDDTEDSPVEDISANDDDTSSSTPEVPLDTPDTNSTSTSSGDGDQDLLEVIDGSDEPETEPEEVQEEPEQVVPEEVVEEDTSLEEEQEINQDSSPVESLDPDPITE